MKGVVNIFFSQPMRRLVRSQEDLLFPMLIDLEYLTRRQFTNIFKGGVHRHQQSVVLLLMLHTDRNSMNKKETTGRLINFLVCFIIVNDFF